jgi:hypothetical protein
MFSFICTGASVQNGSRYDLVDEKGCHEDIQEFASKADIVVCCLILNSETVRLFLCLVINSKMALNWPLTSLYIIYLEFQAGTVNKSFISSMRKVSF